MKDTPPGITQLEMTATEIELAEKIASKLGYGQTAYTSTSAIWGLYCLAENKPNGQDSRNGVILKTKEFGLVFMQDMEDLNANGLLKGLTE